MDSPDKLHVFQHLNNSPNASLQRSAALGDGLSSVIWHSREEHSLCLTPDHYTLASYLPDAIHENAVTGHGTAPKGLCIRSAGHQSAWQISPAEPLAHLYISRETFALTALHVLDKEPRELDWGERHYLNQPLQKQRFRQLFQLNWQEPAERLLGNSLAHDLIQHALLSRAQQRTDLHLKGGLAPAHRQRIIDYIHSNLSQAMTLDELARLCGLSTYHFARMFQLSFGIAPHRYVLACRLQHARDLLRHSNVPMLEIAYACGFSSPSHFNNRFRQHLGATPGQYRSLFRSN
ncbi:helix-turn-helix domain-containing protein [Pseudomonas sp. TTU2014-080ASC]|uniref:helix-turn-helix domain-containing protein n=1 Tax=Pseudomonas sp. TTU2014-080ASC TaxID=1729724 RepID=UPI0007184A09|nr:helix-turn-helix domain-containing protein [Pseudomonas sp. TTU2014-080ASC]KRW62612.1 hypothetical protein AO726_04125 [Pseudomonas sp. TTU2014-080ASC]